MRKPFSDLTLISLQVIMINMAERERERERRGDILVNAI